MRFCLLLRTTVERRKIPWGKELKKKGCGGALWKGGFLPSCHTLRPSPLYPLHQNQGEIVVGRAATNFRAVCVCVSVIPARRCTKDRGEPPPPPPSSPMKFNAIWGRRGGREREKETDRRDNGAGGRDYMHACIPFLKPKSCCNQEVQEGGKEAKWQQRDAKVRAKSALPLPKSKG